MEGEWRLGCPVEHHKQGVHSNIKDLNKALKEVQIAPKKGQKSFNRSKRKYLKNCAKRLFT